MWIRAGLASPRAAIAARAAAAGRLVALAAAAADVDGDGPPAAPTVRPPAYSRTA